jgi:hypothetical protein
MIKTVDNIKYFLKSRTPEQLQVEIFKNNLRYKCYFDYQIMFANGSWFAWYEYTSDILIGKGLRDANESRDKG